VTWTWDNAKAAANRHKHGISFEAAQEVFSDPFHLTLLDPNETEERWRTIGQPFPSKPSLIFVVHTWPDEDGISGRIISAREATIHERKAYENAKR
jgi:uncharacterized protein